MNRRGFIRRCAQAAALCAAAPTLLARVTPAGEISDPVPPFRYWNCGREIAVNPEWRDAQFEIVFVTSGRRMPDPYPPRFRNQASAENFIKKLDAYNKRS